MHENPQDHPGETSDPLDPFEQQLDSAWANETWNDLSLLVAVSGGADSVALLRAVKKLHRHHPSVTGRVEIAHFNHAWRSEASEEDETFVRALCAELEVTCHVGKSEHAKQKEEVARNERYDFLRKLAEHRGTRYLLLAHTADDQAETILHRILRGTGLQGLRGIPSRRLLSEPVTIVRPILWARRNDVLSYLGRIGQNFRTDASNFDPRFTRNRIRHELLPQLAQQYNSSIVDALLRLGSLAAEAGEEIHAQAVLKLTDCIVSQSPTTVELDRVKLLSCSPFLQREILCTLWRQQGWSEQSMGFGQWQRLAKAVAEQQAVCVSGQIRAETEFKTVRLTRTSNPKT